MRPYYHIIIYFPLTKLFFFNLYLILMFNLSTTCRRIKIIKTNCHYSKGSLISQCVYKRIYTFIQNINHVKISVKLIYRPIFICNIFVLFSLQLFLYLLRKILVQ